MWRPRGFVLTAGCALLLGRILLPGAAGEYGFGQVHTVATHPAERLTVVERGGGYFPVICRLPDGEIVSVLRGGGPHRYSWGKARLDVVRSSDGGRSWSTPATAVDFAERDELNPALGRLSDGSLVLAFWSYKGRMDFDSYEAFKALRGQLAFVESRFYSMRSRDGGRTWDAPLEFHGPTRVGSVFGKIVEVDGVALMSFYTFEPDRREVHLLRSRDGGRTWGDASLIAKGHNETALAVLSGRRLAAAMRSEEGSIAITFSDDGGRSWTAPQAVTGANQHPGDLLELPDGRLVLAHGERNRPFGVRALVSRDGGRSWDRERPIVLAWDAPNRDCGYPASVLLPDGRILTIYYQVNDLETAPESAQARAVIWSPDVAK
jgi:hypothetical protein